MTPRPGKGCKHHAIMSHAYSTCAPADLEGAAGGLMRELYDGDVVNAITRCKVLAALRSGPHLVRATMSWMGLDETRPMLISRQIHASVNKATLPHRGGGGPGLPTTFEHVEIAFDCAASPMCNTMYKYAWPSLQSVEVSITLLLDGRALNELPEHHISAINFCGIHPEELAPQPPEWPSDPSEVPGEMVGSALSGRGANDVGSWQSTRQIISNLKSNAKGGGKKGWLG